MGDLPARERRILRLRAGIGVGHPRSRAAVSSIAKVTPDGVRRIEHRGLKRLRALETKGCAQPAEGTTADTLQTEVASVTSPSTPGASTPGASAVRSSAGRSAGGQGQKPVTKRPAEAATPALPALLLDKVGSTGLPLTLVLAVVALVLAAFLAAVVREFRRERLPSPKDSV